MTVAKGQDNHSICGNIYLVLVIFFNWSLSISLGPRRRRTSQRTPKLSTVIRGILQSTLHIDQGSTPENPKALHDDYENTSEHPKPLHKDWGMLEDREFTRYSFTLDASSSHLEHPPTNESLCLYLPLLPSCRGGNAQSV